MALFNLKKKNEDKKPKKKPAARKEEGLEVLAKTTRIHAPVLKSPVISEKSSLLAESGKYAFIVSSDANKLQIKRVVAAIYGVAVTQVNIVRIPAKQIRRGRYIGWKSGYKKAVVTLAAGQKIELV